MEPIFSWWEHIFVEEPLFLEGPHIFCGSTYFWREDIIFLAGSFIFLKMLRFLCFAGNRPSTSLQYWNCHAESGEWPTGTGPAFSLSKRIEEESSNIFTGVHKWKQHFNALKLFNSCFNLYFITPNLLFNWIVFLWTVNCIFFQVVLIIIWIISL